MVACRLLATELGAERPIEEVTGRLRCRRCGARPAEVRLVQPPPPPAPPSAPAPPPPNELALPPAGTTSHEARFLSATRPHGAVLVVLAGICRAEISAEDARRLARWLIRTFRDTEV